MKITALTFDITETSEKPGGQAKNPTTRKDIRSRSIRTEET
jgi:hypothetical protein